MPLNVLASSPLSPSLFLASLTTIPSSSRHLCSTRPTPHAAPTSPSLAPPPPAALDPPDTSADAAPLAPGQNYATHVPLNTLQTALMAVGSGVAGVLDVTRGDLIATLSDSTSSTFLPRLHASMAAHPEGRQILRDRPLVSSSTVDLARLGRLRRGTLGREYVEWLRRGHLSPDSRAVVRYIDSPTMAYVMLRYRQTHDLYHTLLTLPPTLVHELTLKVVELSNMRLPVAALSAVFGPMRMSAKTRDTWVRDWVPWALRVGQAARPLVGVYWEKRWEQGMGELRRELGVTRNEGVEQRWKGYRLLREEERRLRRAGEWVDEPEEW
ncbi:Ubiquinone biosynthesis protein [Cryptotrichosporon argae]